MQKTLLEIHSIKKYMDQNISRSSGISAV